MNLPDPLFSVRFFRLPIEDWRDEGDEEDDAVDAEDDDEDLTEVLDLESISQQQNVFMEKS